MKPYNYDQFVKRVTLNPSIPIQKIYDAWATQKGLESWFLRAAPYFSDDGKQKKSSEKALEGDKYKWRWHGYDDTVAEQGEVLAANGKDNFKFTFSGGCIVTISIRIEKGETICELLQEMIMKDENEQQYFYIECGKGWTFYLANLKSILEGGIDLRNKNIDIQKVINA